MPTKQKILIVEDNSDLRRLYAIGLNRYGYEVKLAANGLEALDRIEQEHPDMILLDVVMPVMDGWEVLERVNPSGEDSQIPVIVVSGQSNPPDHPPSQIAAWLAKPVTIEELANAIATHFHHA
jgi:two-component system, OmpR family, response regulator CpxR